MENKEPELWAKAHVTAGYSAASEPDLDENDETLVSDYLKAAKAHHLLISEVGAWSNPIDIAEEKRKKAITYCQQRLAYADRIGARCCVNIAGSRGDIWDGPYPDNLSNDTFSLIVDTVREIIDAVNPIRTFYVLETMPWVFPDSADSYLRLIQAIDRKGFAVHLDPVNLINCPSRYFHTADLLKDCFDKLGPYIKVCHAKDIIMAPRLTMHLDETRPGLGVLDYKVYLQQMGRLDRNTPLMLEHLSNEEEYMLGAKYIKEIANEHGLEII